MSASSLPQPEVKQSTMMVIAKMATESNRLGLFIFFSFLIRLVFRS
jgi:hypothetical protein